MDDFLHHLPEFIGNHTLLAVLFVVLLGALIAGEVSRLFRGYREVTPAALTLLINRENALVVDLSSPGPLVVGEQVDVYFSSEPSEQAQTQ